MKLNYLFWLSTLIYGITATSPKLETLYEWKYLNVTPVPLKARVVGSYHDGVYAIQRINNYEFSAYFNHEKAVPFDVDKSPDGRIFVTIVGKPDVNVTLTTVNKDTKDGLPLLPYPDYSWFTDRTNCSQMISVRSVTIDKCNRLWVLDSGRIDATQLCNAKLLVFDLNTNTLLQSHEIPLHLSENEKGRGVLVTPVVNIADSDLTCEHSTVYVADSEGYALLVYNGREFRRLSGPEYTFLRSDMSFTIGNETFALPGGITPMTLEPRGERRLFFAPMASRHLSSLNTTELMAVFKGGKQPVPSTARVWPSQPISMAFASSEPEVLFASLADSSIHCWRRELPYCSDNFDSVVKDEERLQFTISLKNIRPSQTTPEDEILLLSNRVQKSIRRNRNFNEINFRILRGSVANLIEGTKCQNSQCSGSKIEYETLSPCRYYVK